MAKDDEIYLLEERAWLTLHDRELKKLELEWKNAELESIITHINFLRFKKNTINACKFLLTLSSNLRYNKILLSILVF